jgi:hypothetical protein
MDPGADCPDTAQSLRGGSHYNPLHEITSETPRFAGDPERGSARRPRGQAERLALDAVSGAALADAARSGPIARACFQIF